MYLFESTIFDLDKKYFIVFHYDMKKIQVVYEKPVNLIPYVNNHKVHSDEQILRLCSSIQEFGFDQPIVVDKNMIIIKGHGRREAAMKLKLESVPIVIADDLDEYQVKAARIADNKTSSNEYNIDALKFDIGTLNMQEFNLASLGIQPVELDQLMKELDQSNFIEEFQHINNKITKQQSEILPVVKIENDKAEVEDVKEFLILITCENEIEQAELFEKFQSEGQKCKII